MKGQRKTEARRWFQQASYDLKAVYWNIQGGFYNTACFLAQQAGEKALKALLYYGGSRRSALLTHSLVDMIDQVAKKEPSISDLLEEARQLDLHYIPSRYPNSLPGGYPYAFYSQDLATIAAQAAERILTFVENFFQERQEMEILEADDVS